MKEGSAHSSPQAGGLAWLNRQLNKKLVLVPLLILLLTPAVLLFVWAQTSNKIAITIASAPPKASVFLDNSPVPQATDARLELAPGTYLLRLELENHEGFEGKIEISESKRIHKITLNKTETSVAPIVKPPPKDQVVKVEPKDKRTLTLATNPPGADVYINDKRQEKKSNGVFEVPAGPFTLKVALAGYKDVERKLEAPDQLQGTLNLERLARTFTLTSDPPGAEVYINEKLQANKTNGAFEALDFPFSLKLVHQGVPPVVVKVENTGQLDKLIQVIFDRAVTLRTVPPGATIFLDGTELKDKAPALLNLKPGKYKVKAVLAGHETEQRVVAVEEGKLVQELGLALRALNAQKYALLIGVRQATRDAPSFVHAESDVETLARTLQVGGFQPDKVAVLTQLRGQVKPAEQPTAANIKLRLQMLAETMTSVDTLVVALVGHVTDLPERGTYFSAAGADQADMSTLVALDDIYDALKSAPSAKKLLILDCWRKDWKSEALARVRTWDKPPPPGVAVLFACGKEQTGYEHPRLRHSAFYQVLCQGLLGEAAQPEVSAAAVAEYCKREVSRLVRDALRDEDQVPVLVVGPGSELGPLTAPGGATADYLVGIALLGKKDNAAALEAFTKAEKVLPNFVELYLQRAEANFHEGNLEKSLADCRTALKLDSNNATAYSDMGEILAAPKIKDFTEALSYFTKALELDPEYALAYNTRGVAYLNSKDYEAAVKDFTEAIRLRPRLLFAFGNRAIAQMNREKWDESRADFDKAIALDDRQAMAYAQRAILWLRKKDNKKAIDDYAAALKRDDSKAPWWYARGRLLLIEKDYDNAIEDLKKATDLDVKHKLAWLYLGDAYYAKGSFQPAKEALRKVVALDPGSVQGHKQLSQVYRRLNDDTNANKHQKIAEKLEMK